MEDRLTSSASLGGTLWTGRERDACGTGFVARLDGEPQREVVDLALTAVERIAHRGAVDAGGGDGPETGDGAGLLTCIPWNVIAGDVSRVDAREAHDLALGMLFLPAREPSRGDAVRLVERCAGQLGLDLVGWRPVPVEPGALGRAARESCPGIAQMIVARPAACPAGRAYERLLYRLRRTIEHEARAAGTELYVASLSTRTVVYKGLLVASQLRSFYADLRDPAYRSPLAVFHQRYSTNTFPAWDRAQPCRMLAHNGEINTLHGNVAWMRARQREARFAPPWASDDAGAAAEWLVPVIDESGSDSAMLDNVAELLVHGGRELSHALTMLVPPAAADHDDAHAGRRALLRAHAAISEPWDGPAAIAFSDGTVAGSCLDRNGLRPARWLQTRDGIVACSSEAGSIDVEPQRVVRTGRIGPGQMLLVDTRSGALLAGDELVDQLTASRAWSDVVTAAQHEVGGTRDTTSETEPRATSLTATQALFGYTREELTAVLRPMLELGVPPIGSMGDDTPLAALTDQPRSLYGCLRQQFAEVTNPPIDPLRERSSMSLAMLVGPRGHIVDPSDEPGTALELPSPLLTSVGLRCVREAAARCGMRVETLDMLVPATSLSAAALQDAVEVLCDEAARAVGEGASIVVLSDRAASAERTPLPSLLAAAAVHQHLAAAGLRLHTGLVVDTGEAREQHHVAALVGHGVNAVCPWLALDTVADLAAGPRARSEVDGPTAQSRLVAALEHGLMTSMSRMGISTADGYCGAQVFEAVGLEPEFARRHFSGTPLRPGSVGWDWLARECARRHGQAYSDDAPALASPGYYKFKRGGEVHAFDPGTAKALREAVTVPDVRGSGYEEGLSRYREFSRGVRERPPVDPRDLLEIVPGSAPALPLHEVESAIEIVRRFTTGAMSHGSLGAEAHETLAVAMNSLGAASNSGEGGEDAARYGTPRNSRIKQVASGRFGVTPAYLRSARELQIKMAQGSKPGEGGHLPGHKVTEEIARIRHTAPGVALISPPPHHDIYSIEDLAQLVHDLTCVNPRGSVSVKLVSQAGVGTIAAGVAKARAATILISGSSGGTGASPLGSIKHAGMPWEWGLAETQQVLVANGLRGRVRVRVDGGLRTGRDVVMAALLGADEFSFGTAALVAEGCRMARTCHNDQCPVGIATQQQTLRALFPGEPDQVAAYMLFVAEEVRELLAALGARRLEDVVGRTELLRQRAAPTGSAPALDLSSMLAQAQVPAAWPRRHVGEANHVPGVDDGLDAQLARDLWPAVLAAAHGGEPAHARRRITNTDRSVGARLSGDIAERIEPTGIESGRVHIRLQGSAGQSLGVFGIRGLRFSLEGEANDFVGKGLAGAEIDVRFPADSPMAAEPQQHVIAGNACLYGATSGTLLLSGCAGERFAVRNSGADAVVEGAGDHLCEYMTGGTVVVLGAVGRNVASGMTGGMLWVLDPHDRLASRLAATAEMVAPQPEELDRARQLVELHAARTGSPRARSLLADWDSQAAALRCVVPRERVAVTAAAAP